MRDFAAYAMRLPILLQIAAVLPSAGTAESATPAMAVIGIWQATRNFGPALRGRVTLTRSEGERRGEIAGQRTP